MYEIYIAIISFLIGAFTMFVYIAVSASLKEEKSNKVHFYVAKHKNKVLSLWFRKPFRSIEYWVYGDNSMCIASGKDLNSYGLNIDDFKNLKWEDEPIEVFLNLED